MLFLHYQNIHELYQGKDNSSLNRKNQKLIFFGEDNENVF